MDIIFVDILKLKHASVHDGLNSKLRSYKLEVFNQNLVAELLNNLFSQNGRVKMSLFSRSSYSDESRKTFYRR